MLEDYPGLEKLASSLPENHSLLTVSDACSTGNELGGGSLSSLGLRWKSGKFCHGHLSVQPTPYFRGCETAEMVNCSVKVLVQQLFAIHFLLVAMIYCQIVIPSRYTWNRHVLWLVIIGMGM